MQQRKSKPNMMKNNVTQPSQQKKMQQQRQVEQQQQNQFSSSKFQNKNSRNHQFTLSSLTTPSTIATTSTIDMTINSSSLKHHKENVNHTSSSNKKGEKTKDILERWKREKIELLNMKHPMKDITNQIVVTKATDNGKGEKVMRISESFEIDPFMKQQLSVTIEEEEEEEKERKRVLEVDNNDNDNVDDNDDDVVLSSSSHEINNTRESIMTTPTTNTALNPLGLERLFNRKINGDNIPSSFNDGVQLFPTSKHRGALPTVVSSHRQSGSSSSSPQSPDVSLITQDTDIMLNLQDGQIDDIMDQVNQEKQARYFHSQSQYNRHQQHQPQQQDSCNDKKRISNSNKTNSTTTTKDVQSALHFLQSKLDLARVTLLEKEDTISKQSDELSDLKVEKSNLYEEHENYRATMSKFMQTLVRQTHHLNLHLNSTAIMIHKTNYAKPQSMNDILKLMKELTEERIPKLTNDIQSKTEELTTTQSIFNEKQSDLREALSSLHEVQQEEKKEKQTLHDLVNSISLKQEELLEIQNLCDDRVQAAHELERKVNNTKIECKQRKAELKLIDRDLRMQRDEFDNDRIAWEAQIQFKQDGIEKEANNVEERRNEIKLLTQSLESNREDLEKQKVNIASVKDNLLEMESRCEDKQHSLAKKESELDALESDLDIERTELSGIRDELKDSQMKLDIERNELNESISKFEKEKECFEDDREQFLQRLCALEENELELESMKENLNDKLSKFKTTIKHAKDDASRKRIELDVRNEELQRKENNLSERMISCAGEEKRLFNINTELQLYKIKIEEMKMQYEQNCVLYKKEENDLDILLDKKRAATATLESLNIEAKTVRDTVKKKINSAQSELASLKKRFENKQCELDLYEEKVRLLFVVNILKH